jgi:glycosyltransferase involved in cell wall biosynthesis
LNEIEGMKTIMPRIDSGWCDEIIIVDGGSTDNSDIWAEQQGYQVIRQSRPGLRMAYNESVSKAKGDIVITFSPDGNSIPELIPDLIKEQTKGFDMVIVSRYLDGAKSYDDDFITGFGNWIFTKTINLLHRGHYTDAMVIFRAWRRDLYTDLGIHKEEPYAIYEKLLGTNLGIEPLLSVRALKRKLRITEIPGDEPCRIGGERKLKVFKWGVSYYLQILRELWYWK